MVVSDGCAGGIRFEDVVCDLLLQADASTFGMFWFGDDSTILGSNEHCLRTLKYDKIVGMKVGSIIQTLDGHNIDQMGGCVHLGEMSAAKFLKGDGDTLDAEIIYHEAVGNAFSYVIFWVIGEFCLSADRLKVLKHCFKDTFDLVPIGIAHISARGELLLANGTLCKYLECDETEIYGKKFSSYLSSTDFKKLVKWSNGIYHGVEGLEEYQKVRISCPNGRKMWCKVFILPKYSDGKFDYFIMVIHDVSDYEHIEVGTHISEAADLGDRSHDKRPFSAKELDISDSFGDIIYTSNEYKRVIDEAVQVAGTDVTTIIYGETGTGKELIARGIHMMSDRRDKSLVRVNCASLQPNLIESELFGHEKGAFTGAVRRKAGRFEIADGGTIFLDEVGELPLDIQAKLLRVLQEGEFEKLGSSQTVKVDVRIIAATNQNLEAMSMDYSFRRDLFYRLNVFPIYCPPLRERRADIPLLVEHFVKKYGEQFGRNVRSVPHKLMELFSSYNWPGNVRELENIVLRGVVISYGEMLEIDRWSEDALSVTDGSSSVLSMEENERRHIMKVLKMTDWKVSGEDGAAKILEINPKTLVSRMKKLGIKRVQRWL